jgi:hypothetical protein
MKKALALLSVAGACTLGTAIAQNTTTVGQGPIQRVLLISIDGMHAVDLENCVNGITKVNGGTPYCPALTALIKHGVRYVDASTSKPSDSFPGLTAIVTGGSPALTGVYYDVAFDRSLNAPLTTTGNGNAGQPCSPGATPTGYTTEYEEGIDIDQTKVNGGAAGAALTDGGIASIDPKKLPHDKNCNPVYPWQFVRANSIFSVIHSHGGYAAWSDKHPAYASVASGIGPEALDDFYAPEINSNVVALPGVKTELGELCSSVLDPGSDVTAWTNSFQNIRCYDQLKVNAILNEIDGKSHLGNNTTKVPNIFGMNFQAVSVAQKLVEKSNHVTGGYVDAAGSPTEALLQEIQFVDASIGAFLNELKKTGQYDSTLVIVTAKHGQSPIDPSRYVPQLNVGSSPATLLSNAGYIPNSESTNNATGIGPTEDDVSLLWLKSPSDTTAALSILQDNEGPAGIALGQIYYAHSLALNFNDPNTDPRTPDIIVTPNVGITYSGSTKKLSEHGGFSHDDTNVMLLVSNPGYHEQVVYSPVGTSQVAPTILKALSIDPSELDAVKIEGVGVLPSLPLN